MQDVYVKITTNLPVSTLVCSSLKVLFYILKVTGCMAIHMFVLIDLVSNWNNMSLKVRLSYSVRGLLNLQSTKKGFLALYIHGILYGSLIRYFLI